MTEDGKDGAFLARWSRRKQEHAQERAREETPPAAAAEARPEPAPAAPLPAIEDLKPDSDFKPFMDPRVDAGTRRSALKMLFTDAHFNAADPFEPYSIDLTGEDPIPAHTLKTLHHAKRLLFDEKERAAEGQAAVEAPASTQPQAQNTEPTNVAGKHDA